MTISLYYHILKATLRYVFLGKRLPSWDFKLQVATDIMRHSYKYMHPPNTDDDLGTLDFEKIALFFDSLQLPDTEVSEEFGIAQEHVLNVVQDIELPHLEKLLQQFQGLGIAEHPLQELFKQDLSNKTGRFMEFDVIYPHSHPFVSSTDQYKLTLPKPLHPDEIVIFEIHGGSFTLGSHISYREPMGNLAYHAKLRVFVHNYRLAPRHPFPAPLQDSFLFYLYLLQQGFKPSNIILCGDSAGAFISLALLRVLNHMNYKTCRALVLISPLPCAMPKGASMVTNLKTDYLSFPPIESPTSPLRLVYKPGHRLTPQYLKDLDDPFMNSLGDLKLDYLPPTLIQCGSAEALVDDIRALHAKISQDSSSPVTYEEYPEMVHVFQRFYYRPESKRAYDAIGDFCNGF